MYKDDLISVIMPTFRRPDGLETALASLLAQDDVGMPIEIIIADNDPEGSARNYVEAMIVKTNSKIIYLHVPEPGVSNARNGALAIAKGRYIAWLDDDQDASPTWLRELLGASQKHKASVVFGPCHARISNITKYRDYYQSFFSRSGPGIVEGVITKFYGAGNSFMDLKRCTLPEPAFDPRANETGGEDDLLFTHIEAHDGVFVWRETAQVFEDVRPHRATPEYIQQRSFAFGQAPSEMAYERHDILGVIKWMFIGLMQTAIYFPIASIARLTGRPSFIHYLSRTCQGAGKVLWWGAFKPKLYGQAVVANKVF